MYHDLPHGASFWQFLFSVDQDLAANVRIVGCACGGQLHSANYPRKPRGVDNLPEEYSRRLSFCCDKDGCRKRTTPPSVRFLGPKVYLGAVVVLVAAMRQGPTPRRVRELSKRFGADRRTIARWQVFWREHFPNTPFWREARARVALLVDLVDYPLSMMEACCRSNDAEKDWRKLLTFLSPITVPGALVSDITA